MDLKDAQFVCELPPGDWEIKAFNGFVLAVCPEHPPRMLHADGAVEIIKPL